MEEEEETERTVDCSWARHPLCCGTGTAGLHTKVSWSLWDVHGGVPSFADTAHQEHRLLIPTSQSLQCPLNTPCLSSLLLFFLRSVIFINAYLYLVFSYSWSRSFTFVIQEIVLGSQLRIQEGRKVGNPRLPSVRIRASQNSSKNLLSSFSFWRTGLSSFPQQHTAPSLPTAAPTRFKARGSVWASGERKTVEPDRSWVGSPALPLSCMTLAPHLLGLRLIHLHMDTPDAPTYDCSAEEIWRSSQRPLANAWLTNGPDTAGLSSFLTGWDLVPCAFCIPHSRNAEQTGRVQSILSELTHTEASPQTLPRRKNLLHGAVGIHTSRVNHKCPLKSRDIFDGAEFKLSWDTWMCLRFQQGGDKPGGDPRTESTLAPFTPCGENIMGHFSWGKKKSTLCVAPVSSERVGEEGEYSLIIKDQNMFSAAALRVFFLCFVFLFPFVFVFSICLLVLINFALDSWVLWTWRIFFFNLNK